MCGKAIKAILDIYAVNPLYKYQNMKQVIFTYGRFNPPTRGHELIFKQCGNLARLAGCDYQIFTSRSHDSKSNPLTVEEKIYFLESFYPNTEFHVSQTVFTACQDLAKAGYTHATIVLGEDRGDAILTSLQKYIGHEDQSKALGLTSIQLYQIPRDGVSVSATSARMRAREDDFQGFCDLIPGTNTNLKRELFDVLRKSM